jgi:hypothetical protein
MEAQSMSDDQRWMLVEQIHRAIWHLPAEEQLLVLDFAWLVIASIARTEALTAPGGLREEQARQIGQLQAMSDLVAADVPKLQMEPFDGDLDRLRSDLLQQLNDLGWRSPDTRTHGDE